MIILFHAGLDRGLPHPIHSTPKRLAKVHGDFPSLRIVAAHMGGEAVFDETERVLLGKDIFMDTSFVLRIMPPEPPGAVHEKTSCGTHSLRVGQPLD